MEKLDSVRSSDYLPSNLKKLPLYKTFTDILDYAIQTFFKPLSDSNQNLYNPISEHYAARNVIHLLGGDQLISMLDSNIDEKTVALLLPDLLDIKGTEQGIKTLLRLLGIEFEDLLLIKDRDGCGRVTIILKNNVDVSLEKIKLLEKFSHSIFSQCASLAAITNCQATKDALADGATVEQDLQINTHLLSYNFRLDRRSRMSRVESYQLPKTPVYIKLCNNETNVIDFAEHDEMSVFSSTRNTYQPEFVQTVVTQDLLNDTLVLDRTDLAQTQFMVMSTNNFKVKG